MSNLISTLISTDFHFDLELDHDILNLPVSFFINLTDSWHSCWKSGFCEYLKQQAGCVSRPRSRLLNTAAVGNRAGNFEIHYLDERVLIEPRPGTCPQLALMLCHAPMVSSARYSLLFTYLHIWKMFLCCIMGCINQDNCYY